jgi:hypothetical protein
MSDNTNSGGQQKPTLSWSQPAAKPAAASPAPVKNITSPVFVAAQDSSSNMGTYVGIFVAGIIIGALVGWGITSGKSGGSASATATSTAMTATSTTQGSTASAALASATTDTNGNVSVPSPQTAGFAVAISKVVVSQPTWLVVYEDHAGVPGNAIGAGLFFAGQTSGTVELLRATLPGQSYFVGQSLDDGDKIFSLQNDKPVRDTQGNPLFTEFTAQ